MLKRSNLLLAALAVAAVAASTSSHAANGTIAVLGKIGALTCRVTSPSPILVNLGNVRARDLSGIDSSANSTEFKIGLDCAGVASQVHMTLSDASDASNRSDKLALAANAVDRGVRIQILRGGALIKYGADSSVVSAANENQFFVGSAASIVAAGNQIAFTARVIQTSAVLTGGNVSGSATFTMAYL